MTLPLYREPSSTTGDLYYVEVTSNPPLFLAIAAVLGVAATNIANPSGACALEEPGWATVTSLDGTSSDCQDQATGLVWSSSAIGRTGHGWSYDYAVTGCSNLEEGGFSNWRLPTIQEIQAAAGHGAITHVSITWTNVDDPNNPLPYTARGIFARESKGNKAYIAHLDDGTYFQIDKRRWTTDFDAVGRRPEQQPRRGVWL
jgi:hypothetical protein